MILSNVFSGAAGAIIAGRVLEWGMPPISAVAVGTITAAMVGYTIESTWEDHKERCARKAAHRARMQAAKERKKQKKWQPNPNYRRLGDIIWERDHPTEQEEEPKEPIRKVCGALSENFYNAPEEIKLEVFGGTQ